ncbi:MAG: UvrB/UvrC motif-containing protein [Phycisphaeraceae bacterium]|nr:UvrB/UvrC motif-containing protein [Phycisphaeraceae bacterium]
MKRKCDKCDRPATHHSVEIIKGQKIEKNFCEAHAAEEGLESTPHKPINDVLKDFVAVQSGGSTADDVCCSLCGLSFSEFREHSLVGCPECYKAFASLLSPLLERAHEGGNHHVGKVPRHAGRIEARQVQLIRLRQRLSDAVTNEDYEMAAQLRDDIRRFEEQAS